MRIINVGRPVIAPVRRLNADEHARDDNNKIERDRCPVLGLHVLDHAAEDHYIAT